MSLCISSLSIVVTNSYSLVLCTKIIYSSFWSSWDFDQFDNKRLFGIACVEFVVCRGFSLLKLVHQLCSALFEHHPLFLSFFRSLSLQGWGLLSWFSPFRYFSNFSEQSKHWLPAWHHVIVWQVWPQLSCGGTRRIWMWLKVSNLYFCQKSKSPVTEKSTNRFSVTPTPARRQPVSGTMILPIGNHRRNLNRNTFLKGENALENDMRKLTVFFIIFYTWGPVCGYVLTLIPVWISNYIHPKVWVKLPIHFQTSAV